jgi:ABC-2 type transport system permease protein
MLVGVAFGTMLLSAAPAIVLYFVMPIGLSAIGAIPWFDGVVAWIDWWSSVSVLADKPLGATEWAHAGSAMVAWLVLPLVAGLWRITRQEIS